MLNAYEQIADNQIAGNQIEDNQIAGNQIADDGLCIVEINHLRNKYIKLEEIFGEEVLSYLKVIPHPLETVNIPSSYFLKNKFLFSNYVRIKYNITQYNFENSTVKFYIIDNVESNKSYADISLQYFMVNSIRAMHIA